MSILIYVSIEALLHVQEYLQFFQEKLENEYLLDFLNIKYHIYLVRGKKPLTLLQQVDQITKKNDLIADWVPSKYTYGTKYKIQVKVFLSNTYKNRNTYGYVIKSISFFNFSLLVMDSFALKKKENNNEFY